MSRANYLLLIKEAELHTALKDFDKAESCYDASIKAAREEQRFIPNELAGIFILERGKRHALVLQKFPFVLPEMGWGAFAVISQADWKIYS